MEHHVLSNVVYGSPLSNFPIFIRFDLGSGTAVIKSDKPLSLNHWHTAKLERNRRNGSMIIDHKQVFHGEVEGKFLGLDLTTPLYLG